MPSLAELMRIRKEEGEKLKSYKSKYQKKRKKQEIKEDIRKIRAARLRAQTGVTKERVEQVGGFFSTIGKGLAGGGRAIGGGLMAMGQANNEYYAQPKKKYKKRRKKRVKPKGKGDKMGIVLPSGDILVYRR